MFIAYLQLLVRHPFCYVGSANTLKRKANNVTLLNLGLTLPHQFLHNSSINIKTTERFDYHQQLIPLTTMALCKVWRRITVCCEYLRHNPTMGEFQLMENIL